ncbi:Planctomycete cytochrome C [Botrimarina colliarenosi]|uniref:Planctomycete cytochrome C n=1 Tax=Botrimarina colliarenosi TaxID=2528001 RepID=A0A5C6AC99_9BACT|nr:PSD1 and planctomycete cytochrome C domain-containing protein [Botrimarina colliarenosi]TWT97017.1 Planctomycete cytochrome C [Botrimarina colliarenosi]
MPLATRLPATAFLIFAATVAVADEPAAIEFNEVLFNDQVRPIFVEHCLACHGGVKEAGGISFVTREKALAEGDSGMPVIEPGDHEASYLYDRVADPDDDFRMPPAEHGRRLNEQELATLRSWINQGANWEDPWAFRNPQRRPAPASPAANEWSQSAIDPYVFARLEAEGLTPATEADRAQWLRRVTFDLIGLPPTESERTLFETDHAAGAYERVVDRLLASPHFGERWASVWLDLARYADTMGFERDPPRDIWPWRDWVVRAFNADLPYDEFLLKQMAGDLVENATIEDRLATALHRNSQTNTEGGTDDEEFRWAAIVDRVDSTWQGVLGMTMGCARCHDHPYDPLWQKDYYRFAGLFNTTQDADLAEDWPKVAVPDDPALLSEAAAIDAGLSDVRQQIFRRGQEAAGPVERWQPLMIETAESTGETRLDIRTAENGPEVAAIGTVTDRSTYTLTAAAPAGPIAALRIDASPLDPDTAIATPEYGFVLSNFRVYLERSPQATSSDEEPQEVELMLVEVLADETEGFFRPIDSLRDNSAGWGPYTRMRRPRWAAFVFESPVELREGERLRLQLKHEMATDGQGPLVMQRLRVSTTSEDAIGQLASDRALRDLREREGALMARRKAIASTATPVLVKQPVSLRRKTYRLDRGSWLSPEEEVDPGTPTTLPGAASDRLELGRWLSADDNPLTARVMVNRVWAEVFGAGLVETLADFGSTGAEPSHPALLDDLAARFRGEMGWSLKRLLRELVLSATYRQDARVSADLVKRDPTNRLLARGPRGRLRAEMVRDQALVVSGKLNPRLGGPPVMPFQPEGVWKTVYNNQKWETAEGAARFRRALYTYWKRTAAYPSMMAFDAPSRDQCTALRPTTNTPLQALVTLNDPAFVELAEALADRMLARTEETPRDRIAWAAKEATGRPLPEAGIDELVALNEEMIADKSIDEGFAMTVVANVILNLDAALTK